MSQFGDRCSDVGLLPSNFEDRLGNTTLSNGMMLEMKKSPLGTQVANKISKIYGCNVGSLRSQITRVRDKYSNLRKNVNKRETLEKYLDEPFRLPVQQLRQTPTKPVCPNCEKVNQVLEDMENKHKDKINTVKNVMARRNEKLKNQGKKVRSKLKRLQEVIGTARKQKDVCRQITSLKQSRQKWRERYNTLRRENNHMQLVHKRSVIRCRKYRRTIHRIQRLKEAQKSQEKKQHSIKKRTVEQKHEYIMELENHIDELEARVESLTSPVQTKVGRAYNAAVREVSYYLQVSFISSNDKRVLFVFFKMSIPIHCQRVFFFNFIIILKRHSHILTNYQESSLEVRD